MFWKNWKTLEQYRGEQQIEWLKNNPKPKPLWCGHEYELDYELKNSSDWNHWNNLPKYSFEWRKPLHDQKFDYEKAIFAEYCHRYKKIIKSKYKLVK